MNCSLYCYCRFIRVFDRSEHNIVAMLSNIHVETNSYLLPAFPTFGRRKTLFKLLRWFCRLLMNCGEPAVYIRNEYEIKIANEMFKVGKRDYLFPDIPFTSYGRVLGSSSVCFQVNRMLEMTLSYLECEIKWIIY